MSDNNIFPEIGTLLVCTQKVSVYYGWEYDESLRMECYDCTARSNVVFMGVGVELNPGDERFMYYRIYFLDPKHGKTSLTSMYFNKEGLDSVFSASFVPMSCGDDD